MRATAKHAAARDRGVAESCSLTWSKLPPATDCACTVPWKFRRRSRSIAHPPVDAWLCLHGTGSNFYAASTLAGLAPKLLAGGAAVLRGNTRGHDLVSTGPTAAGRGLQGAAFERVDDAPLDLAAWIELLASRGYQRIGILGHSLGAVKAIFTLAQPEHPQVAALVAVSPPHLSYAAVRRESPRRRVPGDICQGPGACAGRPGRRAAVYQDSAAVSRQRGRLCGSLRAGREIQRAAAARSGGLSHAGDIWQPARCRARSLFAA